MNHPAGARGHSLAPSLPSSPRGQEVADSSPGRHLLAPVVLLTLFTLLVGCFGGGSKPPGPPVPPPDPDPAPGVVCVAPELVTACWHKPPGEDWQFIEAAPEPVDCRTLQCGPGLCCEASVGCVPCPEPGGQVVRAQARINWHAGKVVGSNKKKGTCVQKNGRCVADATPAECGPGWCRQWLVTEDPTRLGQSCFVNEQGQERYCCPPGCEQDPARYDREVILMGGPRPIWTLVVHEGSLRLVDHPWFGVVAGRGKGILYWDYPNGRAQSDHLKIDKP